MIQKQGNWVLYELKPRNIERRFFTCEMLLARHKRKSFLHRIVTGDEKWIHYDIQRRGNHGNHLAMLQHRSQAEYSWKKTHKTCVFDGISLVSCIMSCSNRTRPLFSLPNSGALYRTQLMRLSRALKEKRAHYSRHDKIILLHNNARPHVAAPT